MAKYDAFRGQSESKKTMQVHPVWRGIGFILMFITPVFAYFATTLILQENNKFGWFAIPRDLIARGTDPNLYVKILGTVVIVFLIYALFMVVTFLVYKVFGPSRLGPMDVEQKAFRGKSYRR